MKTYKCIETFYDKRLCEVGKSYVLDDDYAHRHGQHLEVVPGQRRAPAKKKQALGFDTLEKEKPIQE